MSSESVDTTDNPPPQEKSNGFSLETILNDDGGTLEHPDFKGKPGGGWDEEAAENVVAEGFCVECEGASSWQTLFSSRRTEDHHRPTRTVALRGL